MQKGLLTIEIFCFLNILAFSNMGYAVVAQDIRISDPGGNILAVNSDGTINVSTTVNNSTGNNNTSPDMRLSDNDSNILSIATDGSITLKT